MLPGVSRAVESGGSWSSALFTVSRRGKASSSHGATHTPRSETEAQPTGDTESPRSGACATPFRLVHREAAYRERICPKDFPKTR